MSTTNFMLAWPWKSSEIPKFMELEACIQSIGWLNTNPKMIFIYIDPYILIRMRTFSSIPLLFSGCLMSWVLLQLSSGKKGEFCKVKNGFCKRKKNDSFEICTEIDR